MNTIAGERAMTECELLGWHIAAGVQQPMRARDRPMHTGLMIDGNASVFAAPIAVCHFSKAGHVHLISARHVNKRLIRNAFKHWWNQHRTSISF